MKNLMNRTFFALLTLTLVLVSCGKYEEGPGLSLLSKKMRLTGTWAPSEYIDANGNVTTLDSSMGTVTYENDGTVTSSYTFLGQTITVTGTWEFNSDKTAIVTTVNSQTSTSDPINRLSNKDLWFKDADGSVYKYVKQ